MIRSTAKVNDVLARLPAAVRVIVEPYITELRNRCLLEGIEGSAMMFAVGIVASELSEAADLVAPGKSGDPQ